MGKTSKWIRSFLTGKSKDKDKEKEKEKENIVSDQPLSISTDTPTTPIPLTPTTPKEKRRWSFRRSSAAAAGNAIDSAAATPSPKQAVSGPENEQKMHAVAMAVATAAAADAAMAAAQAAAVVVRLTAATTTTTVSTGRAFAAEEAAATKIQAVFRSHLARKALCALRGLVKLQALVRGHLVRKQATATLRCMQALVTVQARARAQRIRIAVQEDRIHQKHLTHRKSTQENQFRRGCQEHDMGMEENVKIVEMDLGESKGSTKSRNSYSNNSQTDRTEHRPSTHRAPSKQDDLQLSPAPSAQTDMSPRACSGHFEEYSFNTAQSSPQYYSAISKPNPSKVSFSFPRPVFTESLPYDYTFYPSYMANTESSRAKARSQSAPKQRPDSYERQPSRRRASLEGRNIPRAVRMQRSSSHVGTAVQGYQYPWSIKLDRSNVSLKESECGSTSTVLTTFTALTNATYCKNIIPHEPQGNRY